MHYLIGVDIGTSGAKAALVDLEGRVLAEALVAYPLVVNAPGWAEQDARLWRNAVIGTIRDVAAKSGVPSEQVAGICVSGLFAGSGVPVNKDIRPLRNAIIWMDRRATAQQVETDRLIDRSNLFHLTGNTNDAYFGFNKMLWIRDNEPDIWRNTHLFLSSNAFAVYELTGQVTMDVTAAANLGGIYDWDRQAWADAFIDRLGLDQAKLPTELAAPLDIAGGLTRQAAAQTGLATDTPVLVGCTDCLASVIAAGATAPNSQSAIIGTSVNWALLHDKRPTDPTLVSMPHAIEPERLTYTYGGITAAGLLSDWFRRTLAPFTVGAKGPIETDFSRLDREAADVAPGSDGLLALPYFMGERSPVWDADARGVFCGLSVNHGRGHIYRALLESVAYGIRHIRESSELFKLAGENCIVSGGACHSDLWMEIIADVTGVTIVPTEGDVQAPVADALMAGVATGSIPSIDAARRWRRYRKPFKPNPARTAIYDGYYALYTSLYQDTKDLVHRLGQLRKENG